MSERFIDFDDRNESYRSYDFNSQQTFDGKDSGISHIRQNDLAPWDERGVYKSMTQDWDDRGGVIAIRSLQDASVDNFAENSSKSHSILAMPTLKKASVPVESVFKVPGNLVRTGSSIMDLPVVVPELPTILMASHFTSSLPINELVARVEEVFGDKAEISYEFIRSTCTWNAVLLRSSSYCKFSVNIYRESASFVIEVVRMTGDGLMFQSFYRDIKNGLTNPYIGCGGGMEVMPLVLPLQSIEPLSDIDMMNALEPIVAMAQEPFIESQLEASRMLCDLSQQEGLQHVLRESKCIDVLVKLLDSNDCEWTQQHAVLGLANLSASQCCQEAIIDAGVLPALLKFAADGPYTSAAMRRESARLLANLSDRLAARVVSVLGKQAVHQWMDSVDKLGDATLRVHAVRARNSLSTVIESY